MALAVALVSAHIFLMLDKFGEQLDFYGFFSFFFFFFILFYLEMVTPNASHRRKVVFGKK